MSSIAFFCTNENIICLSDGIFLNDESSKKSHEVKKVFTVNERVAVLSVGYGVMALPEVLEIAKSFEISEPKDVADFLSKFLDRMAQLGELPGQSLFLIVGYDKNQQPRLYQVFTNSGRPYHPEEFPIKPGSGDAIAHTLNAEETSFKGLLSQKLQSGIDPEAATLAAFTEMVRDYESQGHLVGGEVFTEIVTPQHVPEMDVLK